MTGIYRGCQALVREKQPLALHVHSGAHRANLVARDAMASNSSVHDATLWVHELGGLYGRSGKYKHVFAVVATSEQ